MFSLTQLVLIMTLAPLIAGLLLVIAGPRIGRGVALAVGGVAILLSAVAAIFLAGSVQAVGPQLINAITIGGSTIIQRLDGFSAYAGVGIAAWVAPVLLWATTPRQQLSDGPVYSPRGMGFVLVAVSCALGAIYDDNIILSAVCWMGVALCTWFIARPASFTLPSDTEEWLDLLLLEAGPVLFLLLMILPMSVAQTSSYLDITGHAGKTPTFTFFSGLLIILALAFAVGLYPFILWVRRVGQGIMTEAIAVLLLLVMPLGMATLARMSVLLSPWPTWTIGPAAIGLNSILLLLGIATIVIAGFVTLFETDLPIMTALLGIISFGWCATAIGTNAVHPLVGIVLLLTAYAIAVGTLLAVWISLEWAGYELTIAGLQGLAKQLPFHMVAATVALLTLAGIPFFAAFTGMITIDQGIIKLGGAAALAGAFVWLGNILAVLGCVRIISSMFRTAITTIEIPEPTFVRDSPIMREGIVLLLPTALLLLVGIAPELLLIPNGSIPGAAQLAAASLLSSGYTIDNITTNTLGFTANGIFWLPGLFWGLALVSAAIVALAAGLTRTVAVATPAFVGGEPYELQSLLTFGSWTEIGNLTQSPLLLPGPSSWRSDMNEDESEHADESEHEDELFEDADDEVTDTAVGADTDVDKLHSEAADTSGEQPSAPRQPREGKGFRNG